jgi:hypothetical protein
MRGIVLLVVAVGSLLGIASIANAQPARVGEDAGSVWFGGGLALGHARIDCSMCGPLPSDHPWRGGLGVGAFVAVGTPLRPDLLMGGEINFYNKEDEGDLSAFLASLTLNLEYFPFTGSPAFVKAGAGVGLYSLVDGYYLDSFMGRTASGEDSFGFALQGGVGYELPVSRRFALVPFANIVQLIARGDRDPVTGDAWAPSHPRHLQLGLGARRY